jgi:hypothetical protein
MVFTSTESEMYGQDETYATVKYNKVSIIC